MHAPAPQSGSAQFWLGIRMFLPVAVSIAAYGVVWGVLAGQAGLSVLEVALMSGLVFAGASQFVALDMWTPGALPVLSIIIAAGIINLRMLLMSATLRPLVGHLSLPRQLGAMFFVSDEQWAMTMAEVRKGKGSVAFLLGTGALSWFAWMGSTLCGRVLGAFIDDPTRYGLDFAFTATFLALLLRPRAVDRRRACRHPHVEADRGQLVHHRRWPRRQLRRGPGRNHQGAPPCRLRR